MKVIIAGSRSITGLHLVEKAVAGSGFNITEVVSGCAHGVDRLGEEYARLYGIPVRRFPAEWDRYGKSAGYRRNEEMGAYAEGLVAVWDQASRGTAHMITIARKRGLKTFIYCAAAGARIV